MSFHRGIDEQGAVRPEPVGGLAGPRERRRTAARSHLTVGTLACPLCDAPVAAAPGVMSPSDPLGCGFCNHAAAVRDFLSLAPPSRPARVNVRVVRRA